MALGAVLSLAFVVAGAVLLFTAMRPRPPSRLPVEFARAILEQRYGGRDRP